MTKTFSRRRASQPKGSQIATAQFLAFVLTLLATSSALAQPAIEPQPAYIEVARRLEPWIAAEIQQKGIPALSIALVDDQKIVWARGFGWADPSKRIPATAETIYRVGSVSKLFTDLTVMQLVEQGKIDLDAPVSRYVPDFAPKNPYDVAITLRQLMSHRSGLVREPPVGHYFDPAPPSLDAGHPQSRDAHRSSSSPALAPSTRTRESPSSARLLKR